MNPRVWIKSISLENVRSFGKEQTIYFTDKEGNAAQWNVILGDNGTGKTTILNGLVFVSTFQNHPKIEALLRSKSLQANILVEEEISIASEDKEIFNRRLDITWEKNKIQAKFFSQRDYAYITLKVAYPASRTISESELTKSSDLIDTFINGYEELVNAEAWLIQADYLSLKDAEYKNRYDIVRGILLRLFRAQVDDIYIKVEEGKPKVYFETNYGSVRLHELSLGYKTLIAWMVDFAKELLDFYPNSLSPLLEPAVCFLDEIDLHLHPKFQRSIIPFLTETFPNTQFIVTAHSPLIVVAAEDRPLDANIIVLKREGDETVVVNDPVDARNWSVDQILNSDLFGHVSPRSESLTQHRAERDGLLAKSKLSKKDTARLAELDEKIGFVPFGKDQEEIKAESIIQQLADVLRKQQMVQ